MERDRSVGRYVEFSEVISTHTLTWSVTISAPATAGGIDNFNSHAHVERDAVDKSLVIVLFISTHTLTWSVTSVLVSSPKLTRISTHTLTWSVTR